MSTIAQVRVTSGANALTAKFRTAAGEAVDGVKLAELEPALARVKEMPDAGELAALLAPRIPR